MTEKIFLKKLREEIDMAQYGEGLAFNLSFISGIINDRIRDVNKHKSIKRKK